MDLARRFHVTPGKSETFLPGAGRGTARLNSRSADTLHRGGNMRRTESRIQGLSVRSADFGGSVLLKLSPSVPFSVP